jgi:hypothetical protein
MALMMIDLAQLAKEKNMASTLEQAIVYIRTLQKDLVGQGQDEKLQKSLWKGNGSSSQTSD